MNTKAIFAAIILTLSGTVAAFADNKPEAWLPQPGTNTWVTALSNNGLWAVAEKIDDVDIDNPQSNGGWLIDIANRKVAPVSTGSLGLASANDVTDDGNIVAGSANGVPAFWNKTTGEWTLLPLPRGYDCGQLLAITPDGSMAVGYAGKYSDMNVASPVCYDLATATAVDLPGMPNLGMNGRNYNENCPTAISPDGRYITGMVAQSYLMDDGASVMWAYVYDRTTATCRPIGFNIADDGKFVPVVEGSNFIDFVKMSPNGKWATGVMRMAKPIAGTQMVEDYGVGFRYNIATGAFEVFDEAADKDVGTFAIDDNGNVYGASPWESPYPEAQVHSGKYYYPLSLVFRDVYSFNIETAIHDEVTGRPVSVSGDGMTLVMANSIDNSYILQVKESLTDAAKQVNLLGNYTPNPPAGSTIAKIKSMDVVFDRAISVIGDYSKIKVLKSDGSVLISALSATIANDNDHKLNIGLRTTTLAAGETYTLVIPAATVCISGDKTVTNREIRIAYNGRGNTPVTAREIYPANGSNMSRIDAATDPVVLVFDAQIKVADNVPAALLYEEGYSTPRASLMAAVSGNYLYLYPLSTQYLFSGVEYTIEVPAGIVTDLSGSGANEAVTITYHGIYVREVNADDTYLFRADGSTTAYLQFLTYDGDELNPAETPESWGFTAATPWWGVVSTETSGDLAFASHSMYKPAGKSDDWMMTPELYIPDENVYLAFDTQGYLKARKDRLKVYVYASDEGYSNLNAALADEIRQNGDLVFDEIVDPGRTEEGLEDEWTHVVIKLDKYADKVIYIAFVNDNENQSAVFVDNIQVVRNVKFTAAFRHSQTMVAQDSVKIEGLLTIKDETETYSSVDMTLKDADGKAIDSLSFSGLSVKNGDTIEFAFANELPLSIGKVNKFSIDVTLDSGEPTVVTDEIKNLVFEPTKRVVLEEFTGSECGNCPLGIVAVDRLKEMYPNNFIPITLRCYNGDILGMGVTDYAAYLGLAAAPTAQIDRLGMAFSPAISTGNDYVFSGEGITTTDGSAAITWQDVVGALLRNAADADIDFSVGYDKDSRQLTLPVSVRYALDTPYASIKLLAVIVEDKLTTYQVNYFSGTDDSDLLPWSKGGSLAQGIVSYDFDDVARGYIGQTPGGSVGLLPFELKGGETYNVNITGTLPSTIVDTKVKDTKVVVMMIDDLTQRIINANVAYVGSSTSVDDIAADAAADITVKADSDTVTAMTTSGEAIDMQVYTATGMLIATANGHGTATADTAGYRGIAIVRASTTAGVATAKVVLN